MLWAQLHHTSSLNTAQPTTCEEPIPHRGLHMGIPATRRATGEPSDEPSPVSEASHQGSRTGPETLHPCALSDNHCCFTTKSSGRALCSTPSPANANVPPEICREPSILPAQVWLTELAQQSKFHAQWLLRPQLNSPHLYPQGIQPREDGTS